MDYVEFCARRGESLSGIGISGVAFDRPSTLKALDLLSATRAVVLGGDVLRRTVAGLEHTYDNWHFEPSQSAEHGQAQLGSVLHARRYVLSYPDPGDGSILYHLVIAT